MRKSAYESQMSLWGALFGGCNFVLHAAGWLESGLTTSYEKFILDIEMLQMFAEVFQPVGAAPSDLALEAVAEVGAGGHFFGCAHTMERYRSAFYAPLVSDWRNAGQWAEDGAKTATERATGIWQNDVEALCRTGARSRHRRGARLVRGAAQGRRRRSAGDLRCRVWTRRRRDITSSWSGCVLTWNAIRARVRSGCGFGK